jgi:hypothetical protein
MSEIVDHVRHLLEKGTVIELSAINAILLLIESFSFRYWPLDPGSTLCSLFTLSIVRLSNRIGDLCPWLARALLQILSVANVHYPSSTRHIGQGGFFDFD